jgi:L-seryl-tRNA(Ser) seleniumtransferase
VPQKKTTNWADLGEQRSDKSGDLEGLLRQIPSVERVLSAPQVRTLLSKLNHDFVAEGVRAVLNRVRTDILSGNCPSPARLEPRAVAEEVVRELAGWEKTRPTRVVNATGVVLHSNLGRALLPQRAIENLCAAAANPVTLEWDPESGKRGKRERVVSGDLVKLTGAEEATIVNNNAAAVFLVLNTLAFGKEVLISRGELMEIGDSFRIPEILEKSGAVLKEVGTTNRTRLSDYEHGLSEHTAVLLKVHPSNYKITGFVSDASLDELVQLGRQRGIPVVEDLGSGALVDLSRFGLPREPIVAERVSTGASLVTFSGDKLLGGPQAGIIVGRQSLIEKIQANPLKRTFRVDKLTLAALAGTLSVYLQSSDLVKELPTLRILARPIEEMEEVGRRAIPILERALSGGFSVTMTESVSKIGSGALPDAELPTRVLILSHSYLTPHEIARKFRSGHVPVIGRVEGERFVLDLRGIFDPYELVPDTEP